MTNSNWSLDQIPDLSGKTAIVTGANVGLGFKTALELARNHAQVIIACRSEEKGQVAIQRITAEVPDAQLQVISLDLTSSDSIKVFAQAFCEQHARLDMLINNAGVVNLETLQYSSDGQEMHMATNHLGHFALTGRLIDVLMKTPGARVVVLSSGGYKAGVIDFDDFKWEKRPYSRLKAYGDSKLANLLFTHQLQLYFESKGVDCIAVSAHPGLTGTERQQSIGIGGKLAHWMATPVAQGCRPQLMAATAPGVKGNEFYGPKFGLWGAPALHTIKSKVFSDQLAKELWDYSEKLTGVSYP